MKHVKQHTHANGVAHARACTGRPNLGKYDKRWMRNVWDVTRVGVLGVEQTIKLHALLVQWMMYSNICMYEVYQRLLAFTAKGRPGFRRPANARCCIV